MKRGLKISMIFLFLFSIYTEVFAGQKIDYYSIPDILRDSRQDVIGNVAMIHKLRIIQILKQKRTYLGQDEAGNKVVLNFTGRLSVSPEFGKIKRLEVGNVYTIFFRISGISSNGVVQGNMEAIGFPNEIPSSVVKRQKEPEVSRPNISQEEQTMEQKESAPEVVAREAKQSKPEAPLEKKIESAPGIRAESKPLVPYEKRGPESKVAELVKPVVPSSPTEKKIEPTPVVPPPPDTIQIKPQISESTPTIEKKTDSSQIRNTEPSGTGRRSVARTSGKTAQGGRRSSEAQGGWMDAIIYLLPLIIGACVSGLTYGAKTDVLVNGVNKFDAWVIRKRNDLKGQEGKGKVKRYWAMPIIWILNGIISLSGKIQNEAIRYGVKTTAYLYLLGIIAIILFYVTKLIVILAVVIIMLWLIRKKLVRNEKEGRPAPVYVRSRKEDQSTYGNHIRAVTTRDQISSLIHDESEKGCSRCKHKLPKSTCGFLESPKYREKVESSYSCNYFLENPAQDHLTLGLKKALEDEALEATRKFEIAIKLGLPQDDEMVARDFLGQSLAHVAKGKVANREFQESINQSEKAVLIDSEGGYGYFSDPIHRATLEALDARYVLQARAIQKTDGVDAAISYLNQKLSLFDYLSSTPLLMVLLELGTYYAEKDETAKARESWEKILNAEIVTIGKIDEEEGFEKGTREMAQNNLRLLRSK